MAVWLVTGGSGFIGGHVLARLNTIPDGRVVALGRRCPTGWPEPQFVAADLDRPAELAEAIRSTRPDFVIHAAGRTPPASREELYRANTLGTLHLLDALETERPEARVTLTGSAAELGVVDEADLPVGEDHECRPSDAYGMSKWLATCAGVAVSERLGVVVARVFNPIGPGQPRSQALGRFAAELAAGATSLTVGDLEARRDFVDVRDVANALVLLAERGRRGRIYHVGTGRSHRVGEALEHFLKRSGRVPEVIIDSRHSSRAALRDSRARVSQIRADTGWQPQIAWERSLDDLLDRAVSTAAPVSSCADTEKPKAR
jgi:GDP-4-dehydro-6-deoxy-D-mannose reductase